MKGQALGVFRLAVIAIVAVALLLLIANLFITPKKNVMEAIEESLDYSQANLGKANTETIFIEKGLFLDAEAFDNIERAVVFKCNSAARCSRVEFDARKLRALDAVEMQVSTRCSYELDLFNCRVYFGELPAQLEIHGVEFKDEYDLSREAIGFSFLVKNSGSLNAAEVLADAKLYRKEIVDGREQEILAAQPATELIEVLEPNQEQQVAFSFNAERNGNYVVEVVSSAEDAGFDLNRFEFKVSEVTQSDLCEATSEGETFLTGGNCRARFLCANCENATSCVLKWQEKSPGIQFELGTKNYALVVSEPNEEGTCS